MKTQPLSAVLVLLVAISMVLAGCQPTGVPPASAPAEPGGGIEEPAALKGKISILWWHDLSNYETDPIGYSTQYGPPYVMLQEWMKLHPEVEVELISHPIDGTEYQYITTNLLAGTLPDLVMGWPFDKLASLLGDPENQELLYDFSSDLQGPNPYGAAAAWAEEFPVPVAAAQGAVPWQNPNGAYFLGQMNTSNMNIIAFYYNKAMFAQAGIEKTPETWAELIDVSQKLEDEGFTSYFAEGTRNCYSGCSIMWTLDWLADQLMDPVINQMYGAVTPKEKGKFIDDQERAWAITNGIWKGDDAAFLESARLMKEWSPYWNQDWLAVEDSGDGGYFLSEKVAIWQSGYWHYNLVANAPDRDFAFGTFPMVKVTKESSEFASDAVVRNHAFSTTGGSPGNSFFVPTTTVDRGNLPIVRDFLQYLTSADGHKRFCGYNKPFCIEAGMSPENAFTDADEWEQVRGFFVPEGTADNMTRYLRYPRDSGGFDFYRPLFAEYVSNRLSLEEFGRKVQSEFVREAEKLIAENPLWDSANWPAPK